MKNLYLTLAIIGAAAPYVFFVQHLQAHGFLLEGFVRSVVATPAAAGFKADLLISSGVFWIYIFAARKRRGEHSSNPWPYVIVNLTVGLSCALPAYLYMQSKGTEALSIAQPSS